MSITHKLDGHASHSEDCHAISQLVAKFDDAVNRKSLEEFCSLWTDDAMWQIGAPREMCVQGIDTIRETWKGMLESTVWLFRGSFAGVVEIDGDTATGRWPCIETGSFKEEGKYDNYALYSDSYRRVSGRGWLIASRNYHYLRLTTDIIPGPDRG